MNMLMERYADIILRKALRLQQGDVLSINTEEENSDFAHLIANKAKIITGNGSFIQNIENGKVIETEEAATDFPIEKKPTALLYLPVYRSYKEAEDATVLSAPEIQRFRHLSEPLDNSEPMIPFASAPVPSADWGQVLDEDGNLALAASVLSDLLGLGEDDYLDEKEDTSLLVYERDRLNELKLVKGSLRDEEGTDLEFSFLPGSDFATTITTLKNGRSFIPTIYSSDIFRALDKTSVNGYFSATRPFMLFGHIVRYFSAEVKNGKIENYSTDNVSSRLIRLYLEQDENAGYVSELSLAEESTSAGCIEYFALPEWDRMRSTSITLGGPRPGSLKTAEAREKANDSLLTLTIPVGSDTAIITAEDRDGNEFVIMEDGFIKEE